MTKEEFLYGLRRALLSTGSPSLIEENMRFYSSYIDGELSKGRSLEEVMEELGDPRLIANSIKTAAGYDDEFAGTIVESEESGYASFNREKEDSETGEFKSFSLTGNSARIALIGTVVVLVLVVILLVALVAGVLSLLAPVLVPLIVLGIIFQIFTRTFRR